MLTLLKLSGQLAILLLMVCLAGVGGVMAFSRRGLSPPPLLYTNRHQELWLWQVGEAPRRLLDRLYSLPAAQWSPDGETIAVHREDGWELYPARCLLRGEPCRPAALDPELYDVRVAWGPDGSTIAYFPGANGDTLRIRSRGCWQGTAGCLTQDIRLDTGRNMSVPNWSANGRYLTFINAGSKSIYLMDMNCLPASCSNQARLLFSINPNLSYLWTALSPDGQRLAGDGNWFGGASLQLGLVELASGRRSRITHEAGSNFSPAWSADGRFIAYIHTEGTFKAVWSIHLLDVGRAFASRAMTLPGQQLVALDWGPPGFTP
jgi:Tol biopolymer transport system component